MDEDELCDIDEPNTKQLRQKDLQVIYTGTQIEAGEKFAQLYNSILICFAYSSAMPILYPISCMAMAFAFWFNKIMLMRYYQKTNEFNE